MSDIDGGRVEFVIECGVVNSDLRHGRYGCEIVVLK
jgi:hypothetical protein